jgi:hypothetical protein
MNITYSIFSPTPMSMNFILRSCLSDEGLAGMAENL